MKNYKNYKKRYKAFTLIETLIAVILYSILMGGVLFLYKFYVNYEQNIKTWNKFTYIKHFIENGDRLVCYKGGWKDKTNTDSENTSCDNLENNSNLEFYIRTLVNTRDKKFYKTLAIYKDNGYKYLALEINDEGFVYDKNISNMVEDYKTLTSSGFVNITIRNKLFNTNLNIIYQNKNFLY